MADRDLQITFGADASALQSSLAAVKGALDGLTNGLAGLKTSLAGLATSIGQQATAMNQLATAMQTVGAGARGAGDHAAGFGAALDGAFKVIDRVNALAELRNTLTGLSGPLTQAGVRMRAFATELLGVAGVAEAGPILVWVAGVAALTAAVVAAALELKHLYDTNATVKAVLDAVGAAAKVVWDVIVLLAEVVGHLVEGFGQLIALALKPYIDQLREAWDFWKGVLEKVWTALSRVIEATVDFIAKRLAPVIDVIRIAWANLRNAISDVAEIVVGGLKKAFDWLWGKLEDLLGQLGRLIQLNFPDIAKQWSKTLGDLATAFHDAADAAQRLWAMLSGRPAPRPGGATVQPPQTPQSGQGPSGSHAGQSGGGRAGGSGHGGGASAAATTDCAQKATVCEAQMLQVQGDGNQQAIDAETAHHAAMEAELDQYLAQIKAKYGQDSEQYRTALTLRSGYDSQYTALLGQESNTQTGIVRQAAAVQIKYYGEIPRKITADNATATEAVRKQWTAAVNGVVAKFTSGLMQMAEGTKTFAQVMRGIGQLILNDFITKVIDPMIEKWVLKELGLTAATQAGVAQRVGAEATGKAQTAVINGVSGLQQIMNEAYKAAAGVYASVAPIPLVGWLLAPPAAAAAFAAVAAFGGGVQASAAGGYDIPAGINPLVQTHAEEMILPASIARPLRGLLAANDAGANDGGGFRGDTHHHTHNWHIHALDGVSVRRVLQNNHADHEAAMESLVRKRNGRGFGA